MALFPMIAGRTEVGVEAAVVDAPRSTDITQALIDPAAHRESVDRDFSSGFVFADVQCHVLKTTYTLEP